MKKCAEPLFFVYQIPWQQAASIEKIIKDFLFMEKPSFEQMHKPSIRA